tara:strand:+ start:98 stop:397 length:300 start_codon:yes stop_codon:yes gene_type:complete
MKYVLVTGKHFKADGTLCKQGDVVELNEAQAKAFADKFKSLAAVEAERDARVADLKAQEKAAAEEHARLEAEAKAQADTAKGDGDGKKANAPAANTAGK